MGCSGWNPRAYLRRAHWRCHFGRVLSRWEAIEGKYYYYPQTLDFKAGQTVERHGIGQDKWQTWLAKVGHVQKSVLILDTCYAGAAAALVRGDDSARQTAIDQLKHATGQNRSAASRQAAFEATRATACSPTRCSKPCTRPTAPAAATLSE